MQSKATWPIVSVVALQFGFAAQTDCSYSKLLTLLVAVHVNRNQPVVVNCDSDWLRRTIAESSLAKARSESRTRCIPCHSIELGAVWWPLRQRVTPRAVAAPSIT